MDRRGVTSPPGYVETGMALRAPRVAVVFPAPATGWTHAARVALHQVSHVWGGAGFVLVPHDGGLVNVAVLDAVAAYDPDYVVTARYTYSELMALDPSYLDLSFAQPGDQDEGVVDARRAEFLAVHGDGYAPDDGSIRARETVAQVCDVFRRRDTALHSQFTAGLHGVAGTTQEWARPWEDADESSTFLSDSRALTPTDVFVLPDEIRLSAPPDLGGPWGAMIAATIGATSPPLAVGAETPQTGDEALALTRWFYQRLLDPGRMELSPPPARLVHSPTGLGLSVKPEGQRWAWTDTLMGLQRAGTAGSGRRRTVVVGDSAADFALAMIIDRMWGNGFWVHSEWAPTAEGPIGSGAAVDWRRAGLSARSPGSLVITSATIPDQLAPFLAFTEPGISTMVAAGSAAGVAGEEVELDGETSQTGLAGQAVQSEPSPPVEPGGAEKGGGGAQGEAVDEAEAGEEAPKPGGVDEAEAVEEPGSGTEGGAGSSAVFGSVSGAKVAKSAATAEAPSFRDVGFVQSPGRIGLLVHDSFSARMALPIIRTDEADEFAVSMPVQIPAVTATSLAGVAELRWVVDVAVSATNMPAGRGLDGHTLFVDPDEAYETWVRSGSRGISYEASRFSMTFGDPASQANLARPRLKVFNLLGWTREVTAQNGYDIAYSDAGRRAHCLPRCGARVTRCVPTSPASSPTSPPPSHALARAPVTSTPTTRGVTSRAAAATSTSPAFATSTPRPARWRPAQVVAVP